MSALTSRPTAIPAGGTAPVRSRQDAADGVIVLELEGLDGVPLAAWTPGAHIAVVLPNGLVRQYSLNGPRDAETWRIGVLRETESRGGSAWLHENAALGMMLAVRGPRNHFPLHPSPH